MLTQYCKVRVIKVLRSPEEYDGWHINQRPPRIGDIGTIVKILPAPNLPVDYVVESVDRDGKTIWLAGFNADEIESVQGQNSTNLDNQRSEVSQEDFEHKLMELLLAGDHPTLAVLRQQYSAAKVIQRKFSGVGFFATFEVPDNLPKAKPKTITGGNVEIDLENVPCGAGCVLFVREGTLDFLECYTFVDPWPGTIVIKSLSNPVPILQDKRNESEK